jgi:hypothetical protein
MIGSGAVSTGKEELMVSNATGERRIKPEFSLAAFYAAEVFIKPNNLIRASFSQEHRISNGASNRLGRRRLTMRLTSFAALTRTGKSAAHFSGRLT